MENENKWEYDYTGLYQGGSPSAQQPAATAADASADAAGRSEAAPAADTGYVNVGSSGTNAANRYETGQQGGSYTAEPPKASSAGWSYTTPQYSAVPPRKPSAPKKQNGSLKGAAKTLLLVLLCGAVGFGGGWLGAALQQRGGTGSKVVVQAVERGENDMTNTSTGGVELTMAEVSARVSPSVVVITTEQMVATGNWFGMSSVQSGAGSGVVMSSDGYIITCAHVVSGASNIIVTVDETDYTATLIGEDEDSDIAVVKIEASGLVPAVIADSDALAVGEGVVAVGNPLGELGGTVTNGIISALNRNVTVEGRKMTLVQTNASVSPGNSGGGLFNMAGELIGIVNAKSSSSDAEGLGFAIPSNQALQVATDLIEKGYVTGRPVMGVTVLTINNAETAARYGVNAYGVYVAEVAEGSGADRAGLQVGDRIISINDSEVSVSTDLTDMIATCKVGDTVTLTVARNGRMYTVEVVLGERSAPAQSAAKPQNGNNGGGRG